LKINSFLKTNKIIEQTSLFEKKKSDK